MAFSVERDLCGHGVGVEFHEEPDVEHFGEKGDRHVISTGHGLYYRTYD